MELFSNFAKTTLSANVTASATSISVASGAAFPSPASGDFFRLVLASPSGGNETKWEICKCTARSGNTLTVQRAQEGTAAQAWSAGDKAEHRLTAAAVASVVDSAGGKWRTVRQVIEASCTWAPPTGIRDGVVWVEYGCSSGNGLYSEPDLYYSPGLQVFWRKIQLSNMNSVNVTIPPGGMYGGASTAFGGYLTILRNEAGAIINGNIEVQGGLRVLFYNLYSVMGLAYPGIKAGASHVPSNADIWGAGATPQSYGFSGPGVLILVYQVPE